MATIVDVARLAGVSVSTVSHVVNGTRPVSDAKRALVEDAISQTGFVLHASARSLRRSRTDSVGLVVSDTGQPVFADMVRGVEQEATKHGFTLLLANSAEDPEREGQALTVLRERRVDGLILARAAGSDPTDLDGWRSAGVPVVLLDRLDSASVDQVGVDNVAPMQALAAHLIDVGHRRIAYVSGDMRVPTLVERHDGFLAALREAGLAEDPALVLSGAGTADETEKMVTDLLRSADRPMAVLSASTPIAAGVLRAVRGLGLRMPEDVAFVTFDSLPYSDLLTPPITTAVQPAIEIGRQAMRLLIRRLKNPDARPRAMRLTPEIVHRSSCCSPEGPDGTRREIAVVRGYTTASASRRRPQPERKEH